MVFGVGSIGLLACALAKSKGASKVVAIDINQTRLDFAKSNGFAEDVHCLPVGERAKTTEEGLKQSKEKIASALSQFGEEEGFDVIFECTGAEPCIQMSVHVRLFVFVTSLISHSFYSPGGNHWWEGHADRDGVPQRPATAVNSSPP